MKVWSLWLFALLLLSMDCSAQPLDSIRNILSTETSPSKKAHLFRELSYQFLVRQELDSCLKYATLGVACAEEVNDERAKAYNLEMVGNYYYYTALYEKAMDIVSQTLKIGEAIKDPDLLARSYSMMGWIYLEQRRFTGALEVFTQALQLLKRGRGDSEDLALAYYGIASVYSYRHSALRDLSLAKFFYDSSLRVNPGLQIRERAFALAELGAAYRDFDKLYAKSFEYLNKAHLLLANESNHQDGDAYILAEISFTHTFTKEPVKAKLYATKALSLYNRIPLHMQIPSVYELLSETFERINDYEMALNMERLNRSLSDSLFSRRNIILVEQIRAQYDDEKRMMEIDRLSKANLLSSVQAKNNRNIAIVVVAASLTIFGLLILNYFNRNRYQRKIQALKLQQSLREERDRIGRDLHDSLGGQLSSISIGLSRVNEASDPVLIQAVQTMADRALHELRDSLWVMNKEVISIESIEQRVNTLFWQYRKIETPMQFDLQVQQGLSSLTVPSLSGGNLYRIIQEATHNAVKHSNASTFQVTIERSQRNLIVTIQDNGAGFEISAKESPEHFGLRNMKKRAEEIDARFRISSEVGKGTLIEVKLTLGVWPGTF